MNRNGKWRYFLIAGVTLVSLWLVFPTLRYFLFVSAPRPAAPEAMEEWHDKAEGLRQDAISFGLDIQGGVDVVLEIDLQKALGNELEAHLRTIQQAFSADQINASLEIGERAPDRESAPLIVQVEAVADYHRAANLLEDQTQGLFDRWDRGRFDSSGRAELFLRSDVLEREFQHTIDGALKVIRDRVDGFGITQASVTKQGANRIRVQIPGERDPERVIQTLVRQGQLSFHLVHQDNDRLQEELFENQGIVPEGKRSADLLPGKQLPPGFIALPGEQPRAVGARSTEPRTILAMHVVRERPEVTGKNLNNAYYVYWPMDPEGKVHQIHVEFDREGARIFRQVTRDNSARGEMPGRQLAIVLDDFVHSAPELVTEIPDGRAVISGNFDQLEAGDLSKLLKYGALPADLRPSEGRTVEATLGADSIAASLRALVIGALAVIAFMIVYYGTAGAIAIVALALNVLLILAIMSLSGATLTLSGIGGIILTLGMGVDANVLIYERIREELRSGKPMKAALSAGFGRAFSVIFDSNLTTLLTALALLQFGTGSVRGFALTMTFGLLANLYTGLTVTYALCEFWFRWKGRLSIGGLTILKNTKIDFMKLRIPAFILSGLLILASLVELGINRGPNLAVDFQGGVLTEVTIQGEYTAGDVDRALAEHDVPGSRTQKYGDGQDALIRSPLVDNDIIGTQDLMRNALVETFGEDGFDLRGSYAVTSEVGKEFSWLALETVFWASLAILAYVWFRFELTLGIGALVALIHDLFITVGLITILKLDLSLDVMSALLILLGYSVNDTIVVLDRLRENARERHNLGIRDLCNLSMNQSLARTIITGITTLFPILCIVFLGGHSLQAFAITLAIGMFFGVYSSGFIALALVYEWTKRRRGGVLALAKKSPAATSKSARRAGAYARKPGDGAPAYQRGGGGGGK